MIIVDFSHLANRNLFVAINQVRPKKVNGKYDMQELIPFFYHLMLSSLVHIQRSFYDNKIILAIDDSSWRKKVYPEYKSQRKKKRDDSDIDYDIFYSKLKAFIQLLDKCFPYYVIQVKNAEADDIIGVLAKKFRDKVRVISSDKDMKQILLYDAKLYDPIKRISINESKEDIQKFKEIHILVGDKGDNIPSYKAESEFTREFVQFLKENGIKIYDVEKVQEFEIFEKLKNEFNGEVYKKVRYGEKTAEKELSKLNELLQNPIYKRNYERNRLLIDFDYIPEDIEKEILSAYANKKLNYNKECIEKFFDRFNLNKLRENLFDYDILVKSIEKSNLIF